MISKRWFTQREICKRKSAENLSGGALTNKTFYGLPTFLSGQTKFRNAHRGTVIRSSPRMRKRSSREDKKRQETNRGHLAVEWDSSSRNEQKRSVSRTWQQSQCDEDLTARKLSEKKHMTIEVTDTRDQACEDLYDELCRPEGQQKVNRLAKTRDGGKKTRLAGTVCKRRKWCPFVLEGPGCQTMGGIFREVAQRVQRSK